jgi:hypothetical protein
MQPKFDRAAEDLGNSIHLEHVNVQVPDQHLATLFYVAGLGLTRDPYLMVSDDNMWVNVGRSQFHLPSGAPQVLRGHTGLVISGRKALLDRLALVKKKLEGTKFAFREYNDHVEATCPWGNRVRCYEPDAARFGRITLGIPYVEFEVPPGAAKGICDFYPQVMGMPAELNNGDATVASVKMSKNQNLLFRETDRPRTSPVPTASCRSAASSTARTINTNTAFGISSILLMASTCSPSSTRCAAPRTRCI